jgi:hypothetical protein
MKWRLLLLGCALGLLIISQALGAGHHQATAAPWRGEPIFVKEAKIPSGRHRLKISVADAGGNVTVQIIQVAVR